MGSGGSGPRAPRLEVCTLHRLAPAGPDVFGVWEDTRTDPADFETYLAARTGWRRLRPEHLWNGGADTRDAFLPTFDDGYGSFRTRALPLLERFDAPCILFVTSGFASGEVVPYEQTLSAVFAAAGRREIPGIGPVDLDDPPTRQRVYREVRLALKPRSPRQRQRFVDELLRSGEAPALREPLDAFLKPEELRLLDDHPLVTIGVHTRRHPLLTGLPLGQAFGEIRGAKRDVERWLGHRVEWFAYPYGACDFRTRQLVRLAGFRGAFTTHAAPVPPGGPVDRLAIPRFDIAELCRAGAAA